MRRILTIVALAVFATLEGCDSLKPDTSTLTATTSSPLERPRCDACHGYPPNTGSHMYHIVTLATANSGGPSGSGIRSTTCYSCHSASIAHTDAGVMDSTLFNSAVPDTFVETDTAIHAAYHTWGWPWQSLDRNQVRWNSLLSATDSLFDIPLGNPVALQGMVHPEWITRAAPEPDSMGHLNGRIDIRFQAGANYVEHIYANDGSDSLVISHQATYDPVRLSCGMVSCHGSHGVGELDKYVWGKTPTKPPLPVTPRLARTKP